MNPTLAQLFPGVHGSTEPVEVEVGEGFEAAVLPAAQALRLVQLLNRYRPHPVGAALAQSGNWVLILPPGSGCELNWPQPVQHLDKGVLPLPPVSAGTYEPLHWARFGNERSRAFTAPLPLYGALQVLNAPDDAVHPARVPDSCRPVSADSRHLRGTPRASSSCDRVPHLIDRPPGRGEPPRPVSRPPAVATRGAHPGGLPPSPSTHVSLEDAS